jgi:peptidoglycan hydrolase CwlO-like protein
MRKLLLLVLLGLVYGEIYGQDARARLEAQRKQLQQEIVQINGMLQKNKNQKADALESLEDLFLKIDRLRELIRLTNRQINALTSQINKNQADISALEEELAILKEDYASMIVKSRKNSSQQNRLMFLFSSENFWQAIKRVRYMNQYAAYRKQQGENIAKKTETLRQLNETLVSQTTRGKHC